MTGRYLGETRARRWIVTGQQTWQEVGGRLAWSTSKCSHPRRRSLTIACTECWHPLKKLWNMPETSALYIEGECFLFLSKYRQVCSKQKGRSTSASSCSYFYLLCGGWGSRAILPKFRQRKILDNTLHELCRKSLLAELTMLYSAPPQKQLALHLHDKIPARVMLQLQ